MAGVFPNGGVTANLTKGADETITPNDLENCDGGALFHNTGNCRSVFDPRSANAMISEVINAVKCAGIKYDCSQHDNLCEAIRKIVDDRVFGCIDQDVPDASGSCMIENLVLATDASGCTRIARYNDAAAQLGSVTTASVYGGDHNMLIPADPANTASYYDFNSLSTDASAGTINVARLNSTKVFDMTLNLACETSVNFDVVLSSVFSPAANGGSGQASELVLRINNNFALSPAGFVADRFAFVTNFQTFMIGEIRRTLGAGVNRVEAFLIRSTGTAGASQAAQVAARSVSAPQSNSGRMTAYVSSS